MSTIRSKTISLITLVIALSGATASAQDLEHLRSVGAQMAESSRLWESEGCTLPFWHKGIPARAFNVPERAAAEGIKAGDYVLAINDEPFTFFHQSDDKQLAKYAGDEVLELSIWRDGDTLTLDVTCMPAKDLYRMYRRLAQSLLNADADACLLAIDDIANLIGGNTTLSLLARKRTCLAYGKPDEYESIALQFQAQMVERGLFESKFFAEDYAGARPFLVSNITEISESGDYMTAARLQRLLAESDEFVENDQLPPDDLIEALAPAE